METNLFHHSRQEHGVKYNLVMKEVIVVWQPWVIMEITDVVTSGYNILDLKHFSVLWCEYIAQASDELQALATLAVVKLKCKWVILNFYFKFA